MDRLIASITPSEFVAVCLIVAVIAALFAIAAWKLGALLGRKAGFERARQLYERDAVLWRMHDANYCANLEAHHRFMNLLRALEQMDEDVR
ncbi:hypothetical protein [Naasia lichenicola]|uniref:Uncharacterized protein n=1 Tax=Naasia lichenicola TaxID=2565933 RepID=A0A4S4FNT4_9MICO|nr:hypothetical protein [Naasia lichenicola]THG30661.1 hypothetical protein E6C64_08455 [Naasia lichenicola]THG31898.1 hypothetical protein E6C64_07600 [Naasia lichenicola]